MLKRLLLLLLCMFGLCLPLVGCAQEDAPPSGCAHQYEWEYSQTEHWEVCALCGNTRNRTEHTDDAGRITEPPAEGRDGTRSYTCTTCGRVRNESIHGFSSEWTTSSDAHWHRAICGHEDQMSGYGAHTWDAGRVTIPATEDADGERTYACTVCGHTKTEPIPRHQHTYADAWTSDAAEHWHAATCEHTDRVSDRAAHTWDAGRVTRPASESDEGERTYTCTVCGRTRTEAIGKLHTHIYNVKKPGTDCLYREADCTRAAVYYYLCSCGVQGTETYSYGDPLGHSFTDYHSNGDATCQADGTKTAQCDRCTEQKTVTDPGTRLPHTYTRKVATEAYRASEADCTNAAVYYYSCTCGAAGDETFTQGNPHGHTFLDYRPDGNATCGADGTRTAKCRDCDARDTLPDPGSRTDHPYSDQWASDELCHYHPATCTHIDVQKDRDAHTFVDAGVIVVATETVEGQKKQTCTVCGYTRVVSTGYADHQHTYDSAWTRGEFTHYHAATCSHTSERKDEEKHIWNDGSVTRPATHTEEGERTYICIVCGATKTEPIDKTADHVYGAWETENETSHRRTCPCGEIQHADHKWVKDEENSYDATLYSEGMNAFYCSDCGATKEETIDIPKYYTITFCDWNGTVITGMRVAPGGSVELPESPARSGYRFVAWMSGSKNAADKCTNVQQDWTFTATYVRLYTVRFVDYDGRELYRYTVENGATLPEVPALPAGRTGYVCTGWDTADLGTKQVSADMTVTAVYRAQRYTVRFLLPDGRVADVQTVGYGYNAILSDLPAYYLVKDNNRLQAYTLVWPEGAWIKIIGEGAVKDETYGTDGIIDIQAAKGEKYQYSDATLYVYYDAEKHTVTFSLALPAGSSLWGLGFRCNYEVSGDRSAPYITGAAVLPSGMTGEMIEYSNMAYTFSFAWAANKQEMAIPCEAGILNILTVTLDPIKGTGDNMTVLSDSLEVYISTDKDGEIPCRIILVASDLTETEQ